MRKRYATLYQLIVDDGSGFETAKKAAEELRRSISSTIGGENIVSCTVGIDASRERPAVDLCLTNDSHLDKVPKRFLGFEVRTSITPEASSEIVD